MNLRTSAASVLSEVFHELSIRYCEGEQGPGDLGFDPTGAKRRPKRKRSENHYINHCRRKQESK